MSYYNDYKSGLPENFMVDFLFDIAIQYGNALKSIRIYDLKYEITKKYLNYIRNSLYNPLLPTISYISMEKEEFKAIGYFENEIKTYINRVKERTSEIESDSEKLARLVESITIAYNSLYIIQYRIDNKMRL